MTKIYRRIYNALYEEFPDAEELREYRAILEFIFASPVPAGRPVRQNRIETAIESARGTSPVTARQPARG